MSINFKKSLIVATVIFIIVLVGFITLSRIGLMTDRVPTSQLEIEIERKLLNQEHITDEEKKAYQDLIKKRKNK